MDVVQLYLASSSSRRQALLQQIGLRFALIHPDISEVKNTDETPVQFAERLALDKASAAWNLPERQLNLPVLGADTIVVIDNHVLGKPADDAEGLAMLSRLSGNTHHVLTAVACVHGEQQQVMHVSSEVTFAELSDAQIQAYWQSDDGKGKAGGYAIQGLAAIFVCEIRGSYSNIVGLPLFETARLLQQFSVRALP